MVADLSDSRCGYPCTVQYRWSRLRTLRHGQLLAHQAMQQVDCLQRPDHDLEIDDASFGVECDDVDAVNGDTVDLVGEFQHGAGRAGPLADIFEAGAA